VIFRATDPTYNIELWISDGTEAGTVILKDIHSGGNASVVTNLTRAGDKLYFKATDGSSAGYELWVTDGTEAGTVLVKDIWPGSSSSNPYDFIDFNGTALFKDSSKSHLSQVLIA
jgi:ELWxxDGT repeat protein